ncbi:MAG: 3-isopropylmalate dehydratase large subunit [Spirochaetales bacterium]|nr:3-isopropylmalate dehydratase large subunit [Spirochaetales bacterium]
MGESLFTKVWNMHKVKTLSSGQDQLFIGLHLIHEVTSPQAFAMLKERGVKVLHPERTFATVDHIVPTKNRQRPFQDELAEKMLAALESNTTDYKISFFNLSTAYQGIVHIIGPELGLTQPGMTIACGDSHTATHGAFGAIAFGIGTSQVRDILATQTMAMNKSKVRRINVSGKLQKGVYAKDVILKIIEVLGVKGGIGYAYEYGGEVIENFTMEERMTVCNMSIEGGARFGYINPDQKTFDYLKGRKFAPQGEAFNRAIRFWKSLASDPDTHYDDVVNIDVSDMAPMITWGIHPGHALEVSKSIPALNRFSVDEKATAQKALEHMQLKEGQSLLGQKISVAFIGSCTNGRISDLREAAQFIKGKKVHKDVFAFVVPGSVQVKKQAEEEGLDKIFEAAGFSWRGAGCSICLGMNDDQLVGDQVCASSSNRNYIGRQGSPTGRTLLMSPAMVAAAAVKGELVDLREVI